MIAKILSHTGPKAQFLKTASIFAGGNFVSFFIRLVSGLLLTRAITPDKLGLFSSFALFVSYSALTQFGALEGLARELPYLIGSGKHEDGLKLASTAKSWALIVGISCGTIFFAAGIYFFLNGSQNSSLACFVFGFSAFVNLYATQYLAVTFRTSGDFRKLTYINVFINSINLVSLAFVYRYDFFGLCIRQIIVDLSNLILLTIFCPIKVGFKWNQNAFMALLITGFPIFFTGLLYTYWTTINQTLIVRILGTTSLGYFQVALMVGGALEIVTLALSQILYPKMAENYGKNRSISELLRLIQKPIVLLFIFQLPFIAILWFLVPTGIPFLFPKYAPAIETVKWALLPYSLLVFKPYSLIFNILKKTHFLLFSTLVGYLFNGVALFFFISNGKDLYRFPQALLVGRLTYFLTIFVFLRFINKPEKTILPERN